MWKSLNLNRLGLRVGHADGSSDCSAVLETDNVTVSVSVSGVFFA